MTDLNRRLFPCKGNTLPAELIEPIDSSCTSRSNYQARGSLQEVSSVFANPILLALGVVKTKQIVPDAAMVESEGIEPSFSPCKGLVLPLDDDPMVGEEGIEPTRCKSHGIYSPAELLSRLLAHIIFKTHRVFQFAYWTYRNSHGINSNPNFPFQTRKLYSSY